jgi:hypothetical protein
MFIFHYSNGGWACWVISYDGTVRGEGFVPTT